MATGAGSFQPIPVVFVPARLLYNLFVIHDQVVLRRNQFGGETDFVESWPGDRTDDFPEREFVVQFVLHQDHQPFRIVRAGPFSSFPVLNKDVG